VDIIAQEVTKCFALPSCLESNLELYVGFYWPLFTLKGYFSSIFALSKH